MHGRQQFEVRLLHSSKQCLLDLTDFENVRVERLVFYTSGFMGSKPRAGSHRAVDKVDSDLRSAVLS